MWFKMIVIVNIYMWWICCMLATVLKWMSRYVGWCDLFTLLAAWLLSLSLLLWWWLIKHLAQKRLRIQAQYGSSTSVPFLGLLNVLLLFHLFLQRFLQSLSVHLRITHFTDRSASHPTKSMNFRHLEELYQDITCISSASYEFRACFLVR